MPGGACFVMCSLKCTCGKMLAGGMNVHAALTWAIMVTLFPHSLDAAAPICFAFLSAMIRDSFCTVEHPVLSIFHTF